MTSSGSHAMNGVSGTIFRHHFNEDVLSDNVELQVRAPRISYKRWLRSADLLEQRDDLSADVIKQVAEEALQGWLNEIATALATQASQVGLFVAMAYIMQRRMRISMEKQERNGDEKGEAFYRAVAKGLQEVIDNEVENERFRQF